MTADAPPWTVRLTKTAECDYQSIIVWTLRNFGDLQARIYAETLSAALVALTAGPDGNRCRNPAEVGSKAVVQHLRAPTPEPPFGYTKLHLSCEVWARSRT
jgi:plasmid stabilization system protein ParE